MKKYEFHVGDYVETKDKKIGYVTYYELKDNGFMAFEILLNGDIVLDLYEKDLTDCFNRIGKYDFTKPQKQNKIDPLPNMDFVCYNNKLADCKTNQQNVLEICDKLNEIIDYINSQEN